ncbi:hypothetical protein [Candidatus Nitrosopumilus sediminis]|uniref:DUF3800 domain-containing protein n=1 Tax=Candidatus Nitrosopumilus sediminis TaxID=1229909 RepID=K0BED3_9ARCH|nr:hypothetical protein [Candidatus Nitrosopumilus sediminis]AFS83382.1 hypothetical protein NSED_07950 [Candidatus Nitrosopumilus sediminis]
MVLVGTDVSGFDDDRGQHKVIAIVFGADDTINETHNNLGRKNLHMVNISKAKRNKIKKNLDFSSDRILALSVIAGKNRIVHDIHENHKTKERFASIGAIYAYFDHLLLQEIRPRIEPFLSKFDVTFNDLVFQCDSDMIPALQNWKFKFAKNNGKSFQLADALAFFCKLGFSPPGTIKIDIENILENKMKSDLLI